jgi:hypothetical protein
MHYIDIGMDLHGTEKPVIGGQIILSSSGGPCPYAYLVYDGNQSTVKESVTLRNLVIDECPHFRIADVGDPALVEL